MPIVIELPEEEREALQGYRDRLPELLMLGLSQVRMQDALLMYRRGVCSFGRAAELAGVPEEEFMRYARAAGVQPVWTCEMLGEDTA